MEDQVGKDMDDSFWIIGQRLGVDIPFLVLELWWCVTSGSSSSLLIILMPVSSVQALGWPIVPPDRTGIKLTTGQGVPRGR